MHSIQIDECSLTAAIRKLKNDKAVVPDNIPGECLMYGVVTVQHAQLELLSMIKLRECILTDWYEGIVKPLFKDGSHEVLSNYCSITISSVMYKVLVTIIENQKMSYIEGNQIL